MCLGQFFETEAVIVSREDFFAKESCREHVAMLDGVGLEV